MNYSYNIYIYIYYAICQYVCINNVYNFIDVQSQIFYMKNAQS